MHNPFTHEAAKAGLVTALAAYLAYVWVNTPDAVAVTVDMCIDHFGEISAVASVSNDHDTQLLQETL